MAEEKRFETGTVTLNYLEAGPPTRAPLVLLHGGAWRWQEYLTLIPALAQRWHLYALDLRGNGRSGWVAGQYRLADFTEDAAAFLRGLPRPAVLVGHSLGGVIALMVAGRCPDRVKALVLEDVPVTLENYRRVVEAGREMYARWLLLKQSARSEQALALALADAYQESPVTSAWILFFATGLWQLDPTFFDPLREDFAGFAQGYDVPQLLAKLACPLLFLRGEPQLGAVMTDAEAAWLTRKGGHVRCTQVRGVGHLLHLQDQGQKPVLAEMLRFLEEACPR